MTELASRPCVPCQGGVPPLEGEALHSLHRELGGEWNLVADHHLEKSYEYPDFETALAFVNRVGEMSEREGHHPDIYLTWGSVKLTVWTHKIDGLTESDFIWAAKADRLQ